MADVSAAMKDWSATSSSNNPSGSVNVGTGLDDNLREIQGSVVRNLHHKGADIASATTTDLGAVEGLFHDITGTTTITGFGTVRAGVWKVIKFEGALTLTHNATSLILPGGANITTADGDVAMMVSEGSGNWRCVKYQKGAVTPGDGALRSVQVFTTPGSNTWTKPAGLRRAKVRVQAPGGGGGGVGSAGSGVAVGAGGGGGGYAEEILEASALGATETVTIGAAGTAGSSSGGNGGAGGTTSFGALLSATGGAGGQGMVTRFAVDQRSNLPGLGGAGTGGTFNVTGGDGGWGCVLGVAATGMGGDGGNSVLGGGGRGGYEAAGGEGGRNYGGGGSGAGTDAAAGRAGGAGGAGIVIVEEYF